MPVSPSRAACTPYLPAMTASCWSAADSMETEQRWLTFNSTERAFTPSLPRTRRSRYFPQPASILCQNCPVRPRCRIRIQIHRLCHGFPLRRTRPPHCSRKSTPPPFSGTPPGQRHLRQIYKQRVVSPEFPCQHPCGCQPACMTAHDLHDRDGPGVIYACVNADLPHCGCHISAALPKPGV